MIAFSREARESTGHSPQPILIVGPQIIAQQTSGNQDRCNASTDISEAVRVDVARAQQELAMVQRALVCCGLISNSRNDEK